MKERRHVRPGASRPLTTFVLLLGLGLGMASLPGIARAQPLVPYTVQVAALSDTDSAIELSDALARDGFPSYVVRAEGAAGSVFRVRVGAFGDRASAERYATTMAMETSIEPRPALAEAIPSGILPLAPTRWFRVEDGQRAELVPWGEARSAARLLLGDGPPIYLLEDGRRFEAWWARPADGGRQEVAVAALDGDVTDDAAGADEASVRDALFRQRLRRIAELGRLDADELFEDAVRGVPGERNLVVWRQIDADGSERILGVASRTAQPESRIPGEWIGAVPPLPQEPVVRIDRATLDGVEGPVDGDGWRARDDAPWTVLEVGDATWRAVVGAPREARGDVLIVRVSGGFEAIRLQAR